MKKFIFGCVMMLCGVICATGWITASASLVQPGAWSSVTNIFYDIDGYIVLFFYALAIVGTVIAVTSIKEKK